MKITIHNVKGSSKVSENAPFPYGSWLPYWESIKGALKANTPYYCPACGKAVTREHFDGCHVQKCNLLDQKWYIIPLCDSCNQRKDMFSVDEDLLVPVPSNI